MAKKESTFLNMFLTLLIVTALSSLAASAVYQVTKGPIAEVQRKKQEAAIKKVMPGFTDLEEQKTVPPQESDSVAVFEGYKDGSEVGIAINAFTYQGYSGLIRILVGFEPDGTINNIEVLEQKETPGLGTKMAEPAFKNQFKGKNPEDFKLTVKKDGGDVDAITAATITSRAFCDAVEQAYGTFKKIKQDQK